MLMHAGRDFVLNTRDVVGFFDLDSPSPGRITHEFLANAEKEGAVVDLSADIPKSFILTDFAGGTVYITQLSTAAIRGRSGRAPG